MKKTYIEPRCSAIEIPCENVILAGSPGTIKPGVDTGSDDNYEDITPPTPGGGNVPSESKYNPWDAWGDNDEF